jgi:hypothetical protein
MRLGVQALLTIAAVISVNCGGGSGGGTVTAPSAPAAQPPAVNVGFQPVDGTPAWVGRASTDQGGSSDTFEMTVQQVGSQLTGTIGAFVWGDRGFPHAGPFAGTVSGNTISFNFMIGDRGNGCANGNTINGTATVNSVNTITDTDPITTNTMTATFSGRVCSGGSITNGTFTASFSRPFLSATRFPIAGTWNGALPPELGGGTWTWRLAQDGDVSGGNLTGSVTFENGNTSNFGTGTVTGRVTNNFAGGPGAVSALTTITFGTCTGSLTANWTMNASGRNLSMTNVSGSICNVPVGPLSVNRQ